MIKKLSIIVRMSFLGLVRFYQLGISPFLPRSCRFYPSCSQYALDCLKELPLLKALGLIGRRLLRCHPFCSGGHDPAPTLHLNKS